MSEIQKQVSVLWDLKKVAEKIHLVQVDLVRIPEDIKKLQANLSHAKSTFENEKKKITNLELKGREAKREAQLEDDYMKKSEAKMKDVTNQHTLHAANREQQERKVVMAKLEQDAAKAMADLETKKGTFAGFETTYQETEKKTLEDCAVLEADLAKLKSEAAVLETEQSDLTKVLPASISTLYTRLSRGANGAPIALVEDGRCQSCHIRVRPQLYNEVIGFKQIHQCYGCRKLLVVPVGEPVAEKAAV